MPGKEQRKTFELRDSTVVVSKLKQMETKIVHSRGRRPGLLCLGWYRRMPNPEDAKEQPDHLELTSQRRILHATCIHSEKPRRIVGTVAGHNLVVNQAQGERGVAGILTVPFVGDNAIVCPLFDLCMEV